MKNMLRFVPFLALPLLFAAGAEAQGPRRGDDGVRVSYTTDSGNTYAFRYGERRGETAAGVRVCNADGDCWLRASTGPRVQRRAVMPHRIFNRFLRQLTRARSDRQRLSLVGNFSRYEMTPVQIRLVINAFDPHDRPMARRYMQRFYPQPHAAPYAVHRPAPPARVVIRR